MMLSRIADSLFWIGRYMERADNTARILDVNYHMLLEQPPDTYKLRWDPLIAVTGERERFYKHHEEASAQTAFEFLGFAEDNPELHRPMYRECPRKRAHHSRPHLA